MPSELILFLVIAIGLVAVVLIVLDRNDQRR
jgi:hypothetical protein